MARKRIKISGYIGGWDTNAERIREQLDDAGGKDIIVEIASPGGLVTEGILIYNELKNYSGKVDTHLTGFVASMATYIAMAGENRTAEPNSVFMIHNASTCLCGDHVFMRKVANRLESFSNISAKEYASKTDTDLKDIKAAMDEETYYFGDEIKEAGFVHEISGDEEEADKAESVALAETMFAECQAKMNTPEIVQKETAAICAMFDEKETKPTKPGKPGINNKQDIKKTESKKMDLEKLKAEHPALYDQAIALGKITGVEEERVRVKGLTEMRAKFKKPHSQTVIDQAISEGHDLNMVSINLMAAEQANEELEAAAEDNTEAGTNQQKETPEMKGEVMTHPDHVDDISKQAAALAGI